MSTKADRGLLRRSRSGRWPCRRKQWQQTERPRRQNERDSALEPCVALEVASKSCRARLSAVVQPTKAFSSSSLSACYSNVAGQQRQQQMANGEKTTTESGITTNNKFLISGRVSD